MWDAVRPPWGGIDGPTSGLFKSTDGGDNWTEITRNPGLPKGKIGKTSIAVSGADRNRVYALVTADPDSGGLFVSDDAGATWTRSNADNTMTHRSEYYVRVFADPSVRDRVYVLNRGFYRSNDGGKTFATVQTPHGDNHDLWIASNDSQRMINANDGGGNVTFNGGRTWTDQDYTTSQIYHITITNDYPYLVCGAQQDNTSKCLPSDGEGRFWFQGSGGEQGYVAQHPTRLTLGWGGTQRGGLIRFDRLTGQRQDVDVWPDMSDGEVSKQTRERFQWTFPIILSPHDPEVLYASSQHLWKSTNGGSSWERISPDLTKHDPSTLEGSKQV
ncbi:MAG: glycosyl hydrolase, partial [Longimicrobiales bacterium]